MKISFQYITYMETQKNLHRLPPPFPVISKTTRACCYEV